MTVRRRTAQQSAQRREVADAGWIPRRGDLAYDKATDRTGVIVALPEDTGAPVYHLRPRRGGDGWPARLDDLQPRGDTIDDQGLTTDEAGRPPLDGPQGVPQ
ncbi:hypothetical protein [Streptomyces sp. BPTC-684]|uniref:hypothetical protein n=1 Tax=Streptomyces sp. BPTC-684 TaxID=3043734 RepID=UPI0024B1674C|nr:hypothetical protein [Streptomyces sp. BPTC-684]WHM37444.1 hypothetical protein QIY60_11360 [Streptomyces sp. BPTC-684]